MPVVPVLGKLTDHQKYVQVMIDLGQKLGVIDASGAEAKRMMQEFKKNNKDVVLTAAQCQALDSLAKVLDKG